LLAPFKSNVAVVFALDIVSGVVVEASGRIVKVFEELKQLL
jgi:hypothetical protein